MSCIHIILGVDFFEEMQINLKNKKNHCMSDLQFVLFHIYLPKDGVTKSKEKCRIKCQHRHSSQLRRVLRFGYGGVCYNTVSTWISFIKFDVKLELSLRSIESRCLFHVCKGEEHTQQLRKGK